MTNIDGSLRSRLLRFLHMAANLEPNSAIMRKKDCFPRREVYACMICSEEIVALFISVRER